MGFLDDLRRLRGDPDPPAVELVVDPEDYSGDDPALIPPDTGDEQSREEDTKRLERGDGS